MFPCGDAFAAGTALTGGNNGAKKARQPPPGVVSKTIGGGVKELGDPQNGLAAEKNRDGKHIDTGMKPLPPPERSSSAPEDDVFPTNERVQAKERLLEEKAAGVRD